MVRVWEYDVPQNATRDFERVYDADGQWAQLFSSSDGYLGTELFVAVGRPGRYLTVDRFSGEDAWLRFLAEHHHAYLQLDAQSAAMTVGERELVATQVD